jgi:hypothetical protein
LIAIGSSAGFSPTSGSKNVYIGYNAGPLSSNPESDKLYIANASGTPLIGGDFAAKTVTISGSLGVLGGITGSLFGTASYATQALSASYAPTAATFPFTGSALITGSLTVTGSLFVTGSTIITGSLRGNVISSSIASTTASLNLATSNFFTLTLANGANTHISASNILPGQTVNIRVTQGSAGTGTLSFNSAIKQSSGSLYTGSMIANAVDVVSLIAFDSSSAYISYINNFV